MTLKLLSTQERCTLSRVSDKDLRYVAQRSLRRNNNTWRWDAFTIEPEASRIVTKGGESCHENLCWEWLSSILRTISLHPTSPRRGGRQHRSPLSRTLQAMERQKYRVPVTEMKWVLKNKVKERSPNHFTELRSSWKMNCVLKNEVLLDSFTNKRWDIFCPCAMTTTIGVFRDAQNEPWPWPRAATSYSYKQLTLLSPIKISRRLWTPP